MLMICNRVSGAVVVDDYLALPFYLRQKSRQRVTLASGREAGLKLVRGSILRDGEYLVASDQTVVKVIASPQLVYQVVADTPFNLMRAAYHLGNRHVPLQIGDGWLRLEEDYVLKEMLLGLGMSVTEKMSPFEPEAGAYGGGHRHGDEELIRGRK